jgi:hypothetical protein
VVAAATVQTVDIVLTFSIRIARSMTAGCGAKEGRRLTRHTAK